MKHLKKTSVLLLLLMVFMGIVMMGNVVNTDSQNYNFYFGGLHAHTSYSDGQGIPSEAFIHARDQGGGDFHAITDHNTYLSDSEWADTKNAASVHTVDGSYVALIGYEMTPSWPGWWGHMNVFNTDSYYKGSTDLDTFYGDLAAMPHAIAQFNHPGWKDTEMGVFKSFGCYTEELDNIINLIEAGCGYGPLDESGDYERHYQYYYRALDKGWHVAPTNNQDNHQKDWLTVMETRTVILAPSLNEADLFDAIRNHRVYATEDKNLKILYKINNQIMGSKLATPSSLGFSIQVEDPDITDTISKIDIIADGGRIVQTKNCTSNVENFSLTMDAQYGYYYVMVTMTDGRTAVTAPIWTGLPILGPAVTLSKNEVPLGETIEVTIAHANNPTHADDWIGLYEENEQPDGNPKAIWWEKLVNLGMTEGNGTFTFDPASVSLNIGKKYKLVLAYDDRYFVEASATFNVASPVVTLSKDSVALDETINITISKGNNPTHADDWIGLYEDNETPDGNPPSIWWAKLMDLGIMNGNGTFTFNPANIPVENKDRYIPGKTYKFILAFDDTYTVEAYDTFDVLEPIRHNIALDKVVSASSEQNSLGNYNQAYKGNDGSMSTRWCASTGNNNHWWKVDLGSNYDITGSQVTWEKDGNVYQYKIDISNDNMNWTTIVDKTNYTQAEQVQTDNYNANARYIRITVTGLDSGCWASFYECKIFDN